MHAQEGEKAEEAGQEEEVRRRVSGFSVAMETGWPKETQATESGSYAFAGATWTPTPRLARIRSPSHSPWLSSLAYSDAFHYSFGGRPGRLAPLQEPHLLRPRPTSLRTQDISHLLTGVFRNLYTAEVIGEEVSANLIKARGSEDVRHEEFVDELQQIRELYKQRLDEVEMLERHIIQARARALAERERVTKQIQVEATEFSLPPVKSIFRWCVDNELLHKHHLICPDDYYSDPVPFCSAPKANFVPGCTKTTLSCEMRAVPKRELTRKPGPPCKKLLTKLEELDYTMDSLTWDSPSEVKVSTKKTVKMVISLQNITSTSRFLRVLPPFTPYFSLGLGMFPGKGGMVAPGMSCQYTIQFFPDCLGDFDDFILVETQSAHTLLIPLQARRPPPVLTLSPVLNCGYCLIGGIKMTRFLCRNVGFSVGRFCIIPKKNWPPHSYRVLFLPTNLGKAEQAFVIVCDNCQVKEVVAVGIGQLVALDLIYVSGEKSQPEPGEFTDLTAQHFIRFEPENLRSTARKQLIIRNATHVELAFHWQVMKPNLQPLMPGEAYSADSIKYHPDRETAFSITPQRGAFNPHMDHEFTLSFSPHEGAVFVLQLRNFHSVFQLVLEEIPEPVSSELESLEEPAYTLDDVIVLEVEVKGSAEPFQVLLEPYALIIPGENYTGVNVKKEFKMWNNSKSPIRYTWGKISDLHIIEVEPCMGAIEPNEVEYFVLSFTGGAPGPTSHDLPCEIRDSPLPVMLHIEAAFKGPALVINLSALQFGLLRLGQKATRSIQIRNISQLPAVWHMQESPGCLEERQEEVSPLDVEPSSGQIHPLGECRVSVALEALSCRRLQTVLELEVVNGPCSYLPVYAEVQEPYVYLQGSQVEVSQLYLGVPTKTAVTLINGTLLPTQFHWGKLLGHQASLCTAKISPRQGTLGPSEERQLYLHLTTHTMEELTDLALPCHVSGMKKPLVLGISGKPQGLQVAITVFPEGSEGRASVPDSAPWPGHPEELRLDFGSAVPLRTRVTRQLILTNYSPIQTPFTLKFEFFGSPRGILSQKPSLPDLPPTLLKTARIQELLTKREQQVLMDSVLSHGKGAAFFPQVPQGTLGGHQQLCVDVTGCANMWGEYWDNLICTHHSSASRPSRDQALETGPTREGKASGRGSGRRNVVAARDKTTEEPVCFQVGDLPPTVIPVHMAVVGCPISSQRTTYYTAGQSQKEPVVRFSTQVSGGDTVTRVLRLNNSSPCDIRLDWQTYAPEEDEDRLVELLVFYGPPFPLLDQAGNELMCPRTPESGSLCQSPSPSSVSKSSQGTTLSAEDSGPDGAPQIISVVLREHDGVPSDHLYSVSPKQVVVPAGGSSTISISLTPPVLGPEVLHKVECSGYALGFMSLDDEVERELPGRRRRLQDLAVGPLRLDLQGYVRPAQLSVELDYGDGVVFRHQASELIPEQPDSGVLSELVTTHHVKLTNTTDIPHCFRLLVAKPFSVSQDGASLRNRAPGPRQQVESEEETAAASPQLVLRPQENMLVNVAFSLSLELLSYQKLPADQMLPGVDIQQSASGEKEIVFTQTLMLEYSNQTTQVVPLRAIVAVPELQLSTSWVDFGTCFVNQRRVREVYLMNLSRCRSYWAVLMGQPDKDPMAFSVSPRSGLLEARPVNAPPTSITLQIFFTARSSQLYESTLAVEGALGEKVCTLRLRGQGSHDERYVSPHQP
ncbi:Deleted in lung and esophageal cancer protein 1 [Galemys pyrenaicus]|uniref:Deleted in lung and esophageal cancer protein 1 n=1 Tax=Galemys pyrenaicus TaxID=202257 RepID=A0A8J6DVP6_GALPY|nr:Deleted in lung and esophageal cancer protein 1 [Galemys pyrenaicus]